MYVSMYVCIYVYMYMRCHGDEVFVFHRDDVSLHPQAHVQYIYIYNRQHTENKNRQHAGKTDNTLSKPTAVINNIQKKTTT